MSLQDPNVVNPARKKWVAIVIANPATSTTTGWPVGFWWSELTHSYYLLTESGYEFRYSVRTAARAKPMSSANLATRVDIPPAISSHAVWEMNLLPRDKHVMPWRIEDEMKRIAANFVQAGLWRPFAIRDGNLITGQQNFSGAATAELLVQALGM
jgi:putative intracellular protease/amidase